MVRKRLDQPSSWASKECAPAHDRIPVGKRAGSSCEEEQALWKQGFQLITGIKEGGEVF